MDAQGVCALCEEGFDAAPTVQIGQKGLDGLKNTGNLRGQGEIVMKIAVGDRVHKKCRELFINKKAIDSFVRNLDQSNDAFTRKTIKHGVYDNQADCLFCGQSITDRDFGVNASCVSTGYFVKSITRECKKRNDYWAYLEELIIVQVNCTPMMSFIIMGVTRISGQENPCLFCGLGNLI